MAQRMIELKKLEKFHDIGVQTSCCITPEFHIQLSKNKHVKLYRSKVYNEYVLTFNINKSKKILVTKSMWKILRTHFNQIDGAFMVC